MTSIYTSGVYLEENPTWHVEDAAWKADKIAGILGRNGVDPRLLVEIGCGAGAVIAELAGQQQMGGGVRFRGYDISPQAIALARTRASDRLVFSCEDLLASAPEERPDVLLVIDVFEHVPDYMGFVSKCRDLADYKVYHIPLEVNVSSALRDNFARTREKLGHLHSFSESSALATLRDTGHEIVDYVYTDGALGLFRQHPTFKRAVVNVPRWLLSKVSVPLSARVLGGYSLLVLAR
jgi:SAM-dependent methyltransferase